MFLAFSAVLPSVKLVILSLKHCFLISIIFFLFLIYSQCGFRERRVVIVKKQLEGCTYSAVGVF